MAESVSGKDKLLRYTRLYVGGYDLSGDSRNYSAFENAFEEVDNTGWDDTVMNFLDNARRNISLRGYQCYLNDTAGRAWQILKDAPNDHVLSMVFGGGGDPAIPDPAMLMSGVQIIDTAGIDGNIAILNVDFLPNADTYDAYMEGVAGVLLCAATSRAATYTGGSHNHGAATTGGWQANLHILASSGGTWSFVIEHSANDSDWSTLHTFSADGSAVTSERGSGSDTVNQYTRAVFTRTSGTVTAVLTLGRVP